MEQFEPLDPGVPPADPEQWTDDQWIEWLKATDADAVAELAHPPATAAGRVIHSTGGQMLGQSMLGLSRVIYGHADDKPVIVSEANSEPEKDQPFALHLDPDHPERSFVVLGTDSEPPEEGAVS